MRKCKGRLKKRRKIFLGYGKVQVRMSSDGTRGGPPTRLSSADRAASQLRMSSPGARAEDFATGTHT